MTSPDGGYNSEVEAIRSREYAHMSGGIYLDHSGATIYAKSLIESFHKKLLSNNLYGNPHSENSPAKFSSGMIDEVREKTMRFLGADPEHFDLVFVANATAAIKLVADSFRDLATRSKSQTFWYGYHKDSHTSLVGVREYTYGQHYCFKSDQDVQFWLESPTAMQQYGEGDIGLFAYPGQSNMTGRRLPLSWSGQIRDNDHLRNVYTLFDAAALSMTFPMESVFRDVDHAPDFTCVSFYKIFGFPDLGGLVVRRDSGHILALRNYFGGGTVTMISVAQGQTWHRKKGLEGHTYNIHDGVEDGTLPFHNILALGEAIDVHKKLYGSMTMISSHTSYLISRLHRGLSEIHHSNGRPVCMIYNEKGQAFNDPEKQGSVVAFNVVKASGDYISYTEVERLANAAGIYIRSGGKNRVCNPGGIVSALGYDPWMMERALAAGHSCGAEGLAIINRRPTGIVRASVGAMTTKHEVDAFLDFMHTTFAEHDKQPAASVQTTPYSPTSEVLSEAQAHPSERLASAREPLKSSWNQPLVLEPSRYENNRPKAPNVLQQFPTVG
ncbi:pyridoxal phosphate-dependent transferase [Xylariales sp. PMI_506]|nr:pyridoxal phosphate-dependent transferase [Xylariales sp. PMI_506]